MPIVRTPELLRIAKWSSPLLATILAACGGGGGFPPAAPDGDTAVISSFATGVGDAAVYTEFGTDAGTAGAVAAQATDATFSDGDGKAAQVTLKADKALLKLPASALVDWTDYRTLLVDVNSSNAISAADAKLVTKSGSGSAWCSVSPSQAVVAGANVTYSFRLDWAAMTCFATPDKTQVKEVYIQLGGGAGNKVTLDNVRLTKSVRVMPLGDSITALPKWRELLSADLKSAGSKVALVGSMQHNVGGSADLGSNPKDHEGHGCILATEVAAAARDSVIAKSGCPTHNGNLEVWLEQTRPELVMMNFGTNDVWASKPPSDVTAAFDVMLAQMRASNPKMHLLVAKILPMAPSNCADCTSRALALNTAIEAWAACATTPTSPITVVDLTTGWDAATMTDDGVHPNASKGAPQYEANWLAAVKAGVAGIDVDGSAAAASCTPAVADLADGTAIADGVEITSFKTGVGTGAAVLQSGSTASAAAATLTTDASGTHATEGSMAAKLNIVARPAGSDFLKAQWTGNGGVSDWSAYRFLRIDATTTDTALSAQLVIESNNGNGWCTVNASTVDANSHGSLELDMSTCSASQLVPTKVQRYSVAVWNSSGTYYFDNVRLEKTPKVVVPTATDVADGTASADGNTVVLTSFKTGVGAAVAANNDGSPADGKAATSAVAALSTDTSGTYATEGNTAAKFSVTSVPAGQYVQVQWGSNGGVSDWSGYRYLRVDGITAADALNAQIVIQSKSDWSGWCTAPATTIAANGRGVLELDLQACITAGTLDPAKVQRYAVALWNKTGTFYLDQVRLVKSVPGSLYTFEDGVGSLGVFDTSFAPSPASVAVTQDTTAAFVTEGSAAAKLVVSADALVGTKSPTLTDWSAYRYLKVDMAASGGVFWAQVVTSSGSGWQWCTLGKAGPTAADNSVAINTPTTVTFDLQAQDCGGGTYTAADIKAYSLLVQKSSGTYHLDNVRLSTTP